MAELISLQQIRCVPNSVVTVGTFDGVHEGHKVLMRTVVEKAKARKARSVVVTFDPHPRDIINPGKEGIRLLTTLEERAEILADLGIDVLCVVPFNRDFSLLTSEAFLRSIIVDRIGVSEFVIGYDHQFGRDRTGTIDTVLAVGEELGFNATVVSKQEMGAATISSSAVRRALAEAGDVQQAAQFLGRPYRLTGLVMHGDERGRIIGFPTANLDPINKRKIIPRKGVYAVWVWIQETRFRGMMNIGVRPTFDGELQTLEVHILDFNKTIYGDKISVEFISKIRDEQKFDGVEALITQLNTDREEVLRVLE